MNLTIKRKSEYGFVIIHFLKVEQEGFRIAAQQGTGVAADPLSKQSLNELKQQRGRCVYQDYSLLLFKFTSCFYIKLVTN